MQAKEIPDAVLQDSKIWGSFCREERNEAWGLDLDELQECYQQRTAVHVNFYAEDIAEAVLHFASDSRSPKSTGNIPNGDRGVKEAYRVESNNFAAARVYC